MKREAAIFISIIGAAILLALVLVSVFRLPPAAALGVFVLIGFLAFLSPRFETIREYERAVLFRFGNFLRVAPPGIFIFFPAFEVLEHVDMRVQMIDTPPQQVVTRDNVKIAIDAVAYFRVTDPKKAVLEIKDYRGALSKLMVAELRNIVGKLELEGVVEKTEDINTLLHQKMAEIKDEWGVEVTNVVVENIELPPVLVEAMTRRQAANELKVRAQREAEARQIYLDALRESASKFDQTTMDYLYLDTLKRVADGKATKIILPVEMAKQSRIYFRTNV